jgi:bifunctional non-homologous end joining protein LigD
MAGPTRKPREIKRAADPVTETITSPAVVRRVDPCQPDLFEVPLILPAKPTLRSRKPVGDRWQYEIKHDGCRAQCHVHEGRVRIYTKSGHDWASRMPGLVADLEALQIRSAVIDGEACIVGPDGTTDFFAIHAALAAKKAPDAILYAFDLLHLDGEDLRPLPLIERAVSGRILPPSSLSNRTCSHSSECQLVQLRAGHDGLALVALFVGALDRASARYRG